MYDAGEPQSVYGNPREQGGLPFFLVLLLTVLGYGAMPSFYVSRTVLVPPPPFHVHHDVLIFFLSALLRYRR